MGAARDGAGWGGMGRDGREVAVDLSDGELDGGEKGRDGGE